MGVAYRAGVAVWFATYTYQGRVSASKSDPRQVITALPAVMSTLPKYGRIINATLEITITPNMEGSRIICYPGVISASSLVTPAWRKDKRGTWSKPFRIKCNIFD
ncbi:hypothetical protein PoB_005574900 [Plakobranchus ocellatus]|uniref:Uncharacterized protein n=1 Tax=Plakobranchus ocellatus TaxID=259542 RepID=A0AAV4CDN7_9GAST|nr:hypothetical protein PoB_005574900 [Plakobranchus ocellatus]